MKPREDRDRRVYDKSRFERREESRSIQARGSRQSIHTADETYPEQTSSSSILAVHASQSPALIQENETGDQVTERNQDENSSTLTEEEAMEKRIRELRPVTRPVVYNLAYFANSNKVLQTFIDMGVKIREWDKHTAIGSFVLQLDLDRDVKPRLIFLHDLGLPANSHALIITKNPLIFGESLENLNVRIEYLKSKRFTDEAIRTIITKAPRW